MYPHHVQLPGWHQRNPEGASPGMRSGTVAVARQVVQVATVVRQLVEEVAAVTRQLVIARQRPNPAVHQAHDCMFVGLRLPTFGCR